MKRILMFMVMVLLTISFASAYMEQYNNSDFWITKNLWGQTGGTDVGGNNGEGLDSAFIMGFEAPYNMNVSEICVASSTTFTGEQIMRIGVVNWVAGHPDYGDNYSDITDYRAIGWTTVNVGESDSWVCANVTTQYLMQKNSNYALVYMYNESSGVRYGYPGMRNGYSADGNNDHYMAGFSGGRGAVEDDNIFNFSVYGPSRTSHAGFAFKLTNGSAWGHPIYDNYYFDGDYPNIRDNYTYAQIFVPSQDISPKKVSSRFYVRDEDTTEGMTLEIRNSTNDILTSCQLNRSITDFQTCTLDSQSERLFLGETYYLTYTCYNCDNDADGSTYIMRGTSINKYGENNQAPAWLVNATSGGDTSYLVFSNNNGTTWQDRDGGKFDGSTFNIEYTSNSDNEPPLTEIDINMTNVFSGDTVSVTGIFNRTELAFNPGYEVYLDTCWLVNGSGSTIYSEVIGNEKNWTCNYDITITGEKDDTFDFTWYVNDTVGNINSATDTVSIVIQQYDVTNITQSWIRYIDAINDTTTITATVVGNYDVTNDVDVIFKINGTTVCTNSTTVLGTTPINVDCTYTTEDNIAMIEVSTNYTGSDSSRMLGIWKEHPFLMGVDYQEQKAILENSSHPWNSKYISWVNDCENYRNYDVGWGYWRGSLLHGQAMCYALTEDTDYLDRVVETLDNWCGRTYEEIQSAGQDSLLVVGTGVMSYDLVAKDLNASKRLEYNDCFYKWSNWYKSATGTGSWTPTNGQGFEVARSLPSIVTYGENNSNNDPYKFGENQSIAFWLSSSYDFVYGFLNGSIAWDGNRYQTYGFDIGQLGFATSKIEYPNGEPIEAAQGTICEWYYPYLYAIIKTTQTFNGDSIRKIGYKEATEYGGGGLNNKPSEFALASAYCEDETSRNVGAWMLNYQWEHTDEYSIRYGLNHHWIEYAREDITSQTPSEADLPRVWVNNQANKNETSGMVIWRSGWETINDSGIAEDTVIMGMSHDVGNNGHAHEDDASIFVYAGGPDGGEEIFTDGGGRRDNEDGTPNGEDMKGASVRHNVLIMDDLVGGWWGDGPLWEPTNTRMFLPTSNYYGIGHDDLWIGQTETGGLSSSSATGWPYARFNPETYTGSIFNIDTNVSTTAYRMVKPFFNGVSGQHLNFTRYTVIQNASNGGNFIVLFDGINNPTSSTHKFQTNWLVAHPNGEEQNVSNYKNGKLFANGVARGYIEVSYASTGGAFTTGVDTQPRGIYQVSDVSYGSYTENRIEYGSGLNNFSSIVFIEPFTEASGDKFNVYGVDETNDTLRIRVLDDTTTYDYTFTKDSSEPVVYSTYTTVVPFTVLNSPEESDFTKANYANSSTVDLTCNITASPGRTVANITLKVDNIDNQTYTSSLVSEEHIFTVTGITDGDHTWTCYGYDNLGEISNTPAPRLLTVDTTPPTITINADATTEIKPLLNLSIDENVQSLEYRIDGGSWISLCTDCNESDSTYLYLEEGSHTLEARAMDYANTLSIESYTWTLDLENGFVDNYNSDRYIEDHEYTKNNGQGQLQFFKLPVQEWVPYDTGNGYKCAVIPASAFNNQVEGSVSTGKWYVSDRTDSAWIAEVGSYCADDFMIYNASSTTSYAYDTFEDYNYLEYYVKIDTDDEWFVYPSLTYGPDYTYDSYAWTSWIAVDDVVYNKYAHGAGEFKNWRAYSDGTPSANEITILKENTARIQLYPRSTRSVIDTIAICNYNQRPFSAGSCPTISNVTTTTIGTGNATSIKLNTTATVNNITATWSITGDSAYYSVQVTANGINWETVPTSGSLVDVVDGQSVQYRVLFNSSETINVNEVSLTFDGDFVEDIEAPIISGVSNTSTTNESTNIIWSTNEVANSSVSINGQTLGSASYVLSHTVSVTGLESNTTYQYNVTSCDSSGNCDTSTGHSFTTLENIEEGDTTAPVISDVLNSSITTSTLFISWTTDELADSNVSIIGVGETISTGYVTSHIILISGLDDNTTYSYVITSCDVSGNCNTTSEYSFRTLEVPSGSIRNCSVSEVEAQLYKGLDFVCALDGCYFEGMDCRYRGELIYG